MMQARFLPLIPLAALVTACASPAGDYPSLAIRDTERFMGVMQPAPAEPYAPPSPRVETLAEAAALTETIRESHAAFMAAVPEARSSIAAAQGAEVGSDAWSDAQIALAVLDSRRNPAATALADLDRIYVDVSTDNQAIAEIESIRGEIAELVRQQDAIIAELAEALPR